VSRRDAVALSMDKFERAVSLTVEKLRLPAPGRRVVAAVSGGPDSVALLRVLLRLRPRFGWTISAGHFNHQLRDRDSDDDEAFVCNLCRDLDVPLTVARLDTRTEAERLRQNLEECARRLRYRFLFDLAGPLGAAATGHTLNDQAETFLLKLLRGAGPSGLSGIFPLRRNVVDAAGGVCYVVRPLLECTREDVLAYLGRLDQTFRSDLSNQDPQYDRNWVRQVLLPQLASRLNPRVVQTLGRTAQLLREVEEYLSVEGTRALQECSVRQSDRLVLSCRALSNQPPILQKEAVRRGLAELRGGLEDLSLAHIEAVLDLAAGCSGREVQLPEGVTAWREFDELAMGSKPRIASFSYQLTIPGEVEIQELGKQVIARRVGLPCASSEGALLRLPADVVQLRNRRPGDLYQTHPRRRPRKLKRLLIERRVPRSLRDGLILALCGAEVAWVEGLPPGSSYAPRQDDREATEIVIRLRGRRLVRR
jgi:tRNA(Ile)-lysidine synthase